MVQVLHDIENFSAIFEAMPGHHALIEVNPPQFTILAITEDYLSNSAFTKAQLVGMDIFECFPSNPNDPNDNGSKNLLASFLYVLKNKKPHQPPVIRYDVEDENGIFTERYWVTKNKPVLNDDGEVIYIIHTAEESVIDIKGQVHITVKKDIQESEQRFQTMAESSEILISVADENGNSTYFNNAWTKLTGKPAAYFLKLGWLDLLHPDDREGFMNTYLTSLKDHKNFTREFRVINKEGQYRWLHAKMPARFNADGSFAGYISSCIDITERKQAEASLLESGQRIRSIIESAPFPIGVYVGKEMIIELANQSMINAYGKGDDVIGKSYLHVLPELGNQEIFDQLQGVYSTGIPFHAKNQRVDLVVEGKLQTYYFNYSFTPLLNAAGKVYGVMNTAADVTDLNAAKQKVEESEAQLRSLVMNAPVGICIVKGDPPQVEMVNDAFLEVVCQPREAFANTPYWEVLPHVAVDFAPVLANVLKTGIVFRGEDTEITLVKNQIEERVFVNFVYNPVKEADGKVNKVMIVVIEVTAQVIARRKIEEAIAERTKELAEANRNLKKSNEELAQFAYIASHDLQEPLRKVSTFSQMLQRSLPEFNESSNFYFARINNSISRMTNLISDVLAYSQLSREDEVYEWIDLQNVVDWVKNDFELLIEQKQAIIQTSNLPTIKAIRHQMSQLISNLISNALKFSSADVKPVITITTSTVKKDELATCLLDQNSVYYNIEFKDNGIGFNQEYATRIFNIFQRLHGKTQYSGTGIGLAICKKIVQNHRGDIYATATKGTGAIFNVILPKNR